ncbi:MAG: 16S rRNA (cytidine(1402)-2'-O)-methyltransferase [Chloroflexi bacterium]|nr:16S rRNA (cytidine(1402)-2'-O)-methyltransferase [Chloroflexota bacterium]MCI0847019.1 16S rRNA (cytidine(1402)-2'-O)-methyltransferase [Chloroflexota bacterium]MCI0863114.1 16S rRNA (cytidine(1402)-2'-O)-methyltransferase [Chloroflexota bacterium]MCI0901265.1 16S rRNA (cytidine(1402)-2'-O)-methyltransferase [Chloroflexota bacterium]MCI0902347.1 16S rRNA (cytidine(1402)-2'-O)-methyltransferase [Chloroflexota bacterium]
MPTLYIVGTPIGNLEDLTPRAARVLAEVSLVAAEDTRVTRRLLSHLGIRPRTTSFHQHNWRDKLEGVLAELDHGDVALVTDAGMPGISDPGSELVAAAAQAGFKVEVVPGPSAVTAALALSGFPGDAFLFLGFLPRRKKDRQARLREAVASAVPLVLFEAPHRLRAALADLDTVFDDRPLAVCRELTKLHEEVFRGTAAQALEHFDSPRGEVVLVVQGRPVEIAAQPDVAAADDQAAADTDLRRRLSGLRQEGVRAKDAVALIAEATGLAKNRVYRVWVDLGRESR